MKLAIFLTLNFLINTHVSAQENKDPLYNDLMAKHLQSGQLNDQESQKQIFQNSKDQKWKKKFNRQVRGVASQLKKETNTIQFVNPAIEISVK